MEISEQDLSFEIIARVNEDVTTSSGLQLHAHPTHQLAMEISGDDHRRTIQLVPAHLVSSFVPNARLLKVHSTSVDGETAGESGTSSAVTVFTREANETKGDIVLTNGLDGLNSHQATIVLVSDSSLIPTSPLTSNLELGQVQIDMDPEIMGMVLPVPGIPLLEVPEKVSWTRRKSARKTGQGKKQGLKASSSTENASNGTVVVVVPNANDVPGPIPSNPEHKEPEEPSTFEEQTTVEITDEKEEDEVEVSDSSDDEGIVTRRCVVCLRNRKFTEDIFDHSNQLLYNIDVLIAHLQIQVAGDYSNTGICTSCTDHLQRWHIFNCAIVKRHEAAKASGEKVMDSPIAYDPIESRVYRNHKKINKVKEVYLSATHAHYARRTLTEKDWDYFCDHLFHSNSVKSEKSKELERFLTSREKLNKLFCLTCQKMISGGKKGFTRHMQNMHEENPVQFPCDICGNSYPERDMTASTEDYYPHWISHFYFNKCDDCGKQFPTKRALGQHRHAVHKNRQVKCEKCGKILANKMSLDLHILRHLPENEKKKYLVKCKICKKKIAQWNLKSHLASHTEDRPWKCGLCEASFKMKGALVSHRDVVHLNIKNHSCHICFEAFKSASSLRGHIRRHEGRKDYKCEVCLKEYYTYSALKGHKVAHQTTRDFICSTCGKAFKKKKALDEHCTIHTGEKRHRCPICGRQIRVKSNLYKHMKIHKKPSSGTVPSRKKSNNANGASSQIYDDNPTDSTLVNTASSTATSRLLETIVPTIVTSIPMQNVTHVKNNITPTVVAIITENGLTSGAEMSILEEPGTRNSRTIPISQANFINAHFDGNQTLLSLPHQQQQDLLNGSMTVGTFFNNAGQQTPYFSELDSL